MPILLCIKEWIPKVTEFVEFVETLTEELYWEFSWALGYAPEVNKWNPQLD